MIRQKTDLSPADILRKIKDRSEIAVAMKNFKGKIKILPPGKNIPPRNYYYGLYGGILDIQRVIFHGCGYKNMSESI